MFNVGSCEKKAQAVGNVKRESNFIGLIGLGISKEQRSLFPTVAVARLLNMSLNI